MSPTRIRLALALASMLSAFACADPQPDPCESDSFGCESDYESLVMESECALDGPLTVAAGWGDDGFHGFDEAPRVHQGFQGGSHVFLAARVSAPELQERDVRLRLWSFSAMSVDGCASAIDSARTYDPDDLPVELRDDPSATADPAQPVFVQWAAQEPWFPPMGPSRCWSSNTQRTLILGDDEALPIDADGVLSVSGILAQLPWDYESGVVVLVEAQDSCGRTGFDAVLFDP